MLDLSEHSWCLHVVCYFFHDSNILTVTMIFHDANSATRTLMLRTSQFSENFQKSYHDTYRGV
jgi:hypothetical protein